MHDYPDIGHLLTLDSYYFTEKPDTGDTIVPFPKNFRMIAGNSNKRDFTTGNPANADPDMGHWPPITNSTAQKFLAERAIGWNCLNYHNSAAEGSLQYHGLRPKSFLDSNCLDGIRAELMFPSCWNGQDLDSPDHHSHVQYRERLRDGPCPPGYNISLPVLFYETIFQTNAFASMPGQFITANGDPTGYGYHGDFIAGWDDGVLDAVLVTPNCTAPEPTFVISGNQWDCPVFNLQSDDIATSCKIPIPDVLKDERTRGVVHALPGNIQIQYGPEDAAAVGLGAMQDTPVASPSVASPSVVPSSALLTNTSPAIIMSSPPIEDAPLTTMSTSQANVLVTSTSTFVSNGVDVYMVIIEEVVTTTITADIATATVAAKRHVHKHVHGGYGRF